MAALSLPFVDGAFGLGAHRAKDGTAVTVRLAREPDAPAILGLIRGLAVYEREPASTVEVTEARLRRDGWGPAPLFRVLLAEDQGGAAIGFALFFPTYSTWQGRCMFLEDLFVVERARGRGVGSLLLKTTAALAREEGCSRFSWQALDWNAPALAFYAQLGAARLDSWVNLRLGRAELGALLLRRPDDEGPP